MKKLYSSMLLLCLFAGLTAAGQEKTKKPSSQKVSEYDEIVIKQKNPGKNARVIVEVKDGDVIVNGKPIEKFDDKEIIVQKRSPRVITLNESRSPFREPGAAYDTKVDGDFHWESDVRPFLGVSTEKAPDGVKVQDVTENSGAEKAGIKEGDIITKINEKKIESPGQLSELVSTYKPNDKVTVTVKRAGKDVKLNAVLGERKAPMAMTFRNVQPFHEMEDFNFQMPPNGPDHFYVMPDGKPRLGLRAQDTEDGKGVKVLDVDDDSPADKAGIEEDDIITAVEGKAVNSADELASAYKENKEKTPMKFSILRDGKSSIVEVKIPKKLKTANL
ncbi:MAG TPA: PDZ domain-containing protein [Flavitalea sp.]|nr:PDZ domain-containing protein [Flavitalea sp.]